MMTIRIPGKVMLSGEYAVLHEGRALMMPVHRYVTISDESGSEEESLSPVVRLALTYPIERLRQEPIRTEFRIDRTEHYGRAADGKFTKLGLGSSAAEAVAVIAFRFQLAGVDWQNFRSEIAKIADEVHRQAQSGLGSGADVAVCAYGRPLLFARADDTPTVDLIDPQKSLTLPLHLVWSGQAANTRLMIRKFDYWRDAKSGASSRLNGLVEISHRLAPLWYGSDPDSLLSAVDEWLDAMNAIANEAELPFTTDFHRELDQWARSHGGRCKPTGAGGGDMVLLIGELPVKELSQPVISLATSN